MKIEELLLKKEELPILHETCFFIPIHPRLFDPSVRIDERVANSVFPEVAREWYKELSAYAETLNDEQTKNWIKDVFLKKKPKIKREYGRQVLDGIYWEDQVRLDPNGFAHSLSISRNSGGTLYFNPTDHSIGGAVRLSTGSEYIRFSEEKLREFAREMHKWDDGEFAILNTYNQHNVDYYPGALFLRNWAIAYMNSVFVRHSELFVK